MTTKSETYIWNREAESLSRADLEKLQLTRLKQIIEKVYNRVPLFKTRCHESNLNPQSLRSIDDLSLFPFTSKTDLRDHYPFGLFCQPLENVRRLHASSGTKGKPTVVGYTDNDLETWKEACARSLACAGARPADVIHNAYGYGLFTGGLGMHYGAEKLAATVVPASGGRTQQQILLLQDLQARVILSTPSYALNIAYTMHDLGIKRESINLEIGIFGAEPWTEQLRFQIEQILEIRALDIYGLSEVMGPGISMECMEGRNGLHIWEDLFYPEIIDPQTEETLPLGKEGELVFTSLVKEAIPLIRYKTGDISSLDQDKCPCGRTMVRMQRVKARLDDMLIIRGVNLYPSEIEKELLQIDDLSPNYQLVIDRKRALDTLKVQIEVTEDLVENWGCFDDGHLEFGRLTSRIKSILKDSLGLTAEVELMKPRSLPRSQGKAVRVVDNRKSG